jgi:hypothetical protein
MFYAKVEKDVEEYSNEISRAINEAPSPGACLWYSTEDGGTATPCFLIDRAEEVVEHLKVWTEGNPSEWFKLFVYAESDKYHVVLFPNLEKSIERFKISMLHLTGEFADNHGKFSLLFRPLHFISPGLGYGSKMLSKVGKTAMLGFLDAKTDHNDFQHAKPVEVGPFEVNPEGFMKGQWKNYLRNSEKY